MTTHDHDAAQQPPAADSADSAATFDALLLDARTAAINMCMCDDEDYPDYTAIYHGKAEKLVSFITRHAGPIRAALRPHLSDGDSGGSR